MKRWGFWPVDVSLAMVKAGFATVYHGKDAEYGSLKEAYLKAEEIARKKKIGMWQQSSSHYESPAEYKRRIKNTPLIS